MVLLETILMVLFSENLFLLRIFQDLLKTGAIVIGRHAFGDIYNCTDFTVPEAGQLSATFKGTTVGEQTHQVYNFPGKGVALVMFNLDSSIEAFGHSCFKYALNKKYPLYMTTKNTILKVYDGRFKDIFQRLYDQTYKK
jgi:isocitrate dehydrogenase